MTAAFLLFRAIVMHRPGPAAVALALGLSLAGCGGTPSIEAPEATTRGEGLGPVVLTAGWLYPQGPRVTRFVRAETAEGEPRVLERVVTATEPDGRFEIIQRVAADQSGFGAGGDAAGEAILTGTAARLALEQGASEESLIRRVWLRRMPDGSVVLERVRSSQDESTGGAPFRYLVYDPPLTMTRAEMRAGEVLSGETDLSERSFEEPERERARGTVSRQMWVAERPSGSVGGAAGPGVEATRELAGVVLDVVRRENAVLVLERLRVEHRGAIAQREHAWAIAPTDGGAGSGGPLASRERMRVRFFGLPVQADENAEVRADLTEVRDEDDGARAGAE